MASILANYNSVERDKNIRFYARGHKYEITTDLFSKYTSVTTWVKGHFPKFDADAIIANIFKSKSWGPENKYWGQTADQIKAGWKANGDSVAGAGTELHERIELFMNEPDLPRGYTHKQLYELYVSRNSNEKLLTEPLEWQYFIQFVKDTPELKPFRTEWLVYHEDVKIAGAIDMIYINPDNTLAIYDWKRSKEISRYNNWGQKSLNPVIVHIPDTNFWHYSLQLNTYKTILEEKYGYKVTGLTLVQLHPDNKGYELINVPVLKEELGNLFEERIEKI